MTGPTVDRSTGDGELVGDALLGDATALTAGGLVAGAALDCTELGTALGDTTEVGDTALEIAALKIGMLGLAAPRLVALAAE